MAVKPQMDISTIEVLSQFWFVVVDGTSASTPRQTAELVCALSLAGVLVSTAALPGFARALIDPELLEITDRIDERWVANRDRREVLSLLVLRLAQARYGRTFDSHARNLVVNVPLPSVTPDAYDRLVRQMARQSWPNVTVVPPLNESQIGGSGPGGSLPTGSADITVPSFVANVDPNALYAPHHIEDLILAVLYSGHADIRVPKRYFYVPEMGAIAERRNFDQGEGKSVPPPVALRYKSVNEVETEGYAIHGCNVVSVLHAKNAGNILDGARVHRTLPPQLEWLDAELDLAASGS